MPRERAAGASHCSVRSAEPPRGWARTASVGSIAETSPNRISAKGRRRIGRAELALLRSIRNPPRCRGCRDATSRPPSPSRIRRDLDRSMGEQSSWRCRDHVGSLVRRTGETHGSPWTRLTARIVHPGPPGSSRLGSPRRDRIRRPPMRRAPGSPPGLTSTISPLASISPNRSVTSTICVTPTSRPCAFALRVPPTVKTFEDCMTLTAKP